MSAEKVITMPVREIADVKVILATWYKFLQDQADKLNAEEFSRSLKTPIILNLETDELELLFTGSGELLQGFKDFILTTT
ncbi:MAG TPA: hypothetical protein PKE49_18010 [Leptospiraceae bacterium]|jgi:hypothetical protein|nr:hypothetical protein [Leptospirales bacterium]HMU81761.1 hypothetical protein [Leptospiraceae bacterium]HMW59350.1 hypothetical protein [Leptospiraceae bacterium]HMX58427.1 hypothetical protein [Leptospiraceae bacterium]HMY45827.1 hypothetical protein [Leptospiraceae bacterium]